MSRLRLSVVVVSAGRPDALRRCVASLSQMRSDAFEVIVVADAAGLQVARNASFADRPMLLEQRAPNISIARNDGIAAAAGRIVAFIDDDAVPEPSWASAILSAFEDADLAAVTGPVLGRNGISLQWGRMAVDRSGRDRWLTGGDNPGPGETLKLHGTNMAIRRTNLTRTGGFDPAFAFYLDETDLARRLADDGARLSYLDHAVVHHGFAASARRSEDRVPLNLHDIGASSAVFLRKHAPDTMAEDLNRLETEQRRRVLRLARKRKIDPVQMRHLMETLAAGIADGMDRVAAPPVVTTAARAFTPLRSTVSPEMVYMNGWRRNAIALRKKAAALVSAGQPVTLILLEATPRKHRMVFTEGGWWEQTGGLFGPSDRSGHRIQLWGYRGRIAAELARIQALRERE